MTETAEDTHTGTLNDYGDALSKTAAGAWAGPREEMGERILRMFLALWENPEMQPRLLETVRSAIDGGPGLEKMKAFMGSQLFGKVGSNLNGTPLSLEEAAAELGVDPLNISAAASQAWGIIMLRYVLKIEPMASATPEHIVATMSKTFQNYLVH
jgi:hypothetical protein